MDVARSLSGVSVLLVLFTLVFTFTSCSSDDDDSSSTSNSIVGTWLYEETDEDGDYNSYTLVFNSNGTGTARNYYTYDAMTVDITDAFDYKYDEEDEELVIILNEEGSEIYYAFFKSTTYYDVVVVNNSLKCKGIYFTRQ